MSGGLDIPIKYLSTRLDNGTAGGGTVDGRMAFFGNGSVRKCAGTTEIHLQTGTAGNIGLTGAA